jgi:hypothetical protein
VIEAPLFQAIPSAAIILRVIEAPLFQAIPPAAIILRVIEAPFLQAITIKIPVRESHQNPPSITSSTPLKISSNSSLGSSSRNFKIN